MKRTPAEKHAWLLERGAERYAETYLRLMKHAAQGGTLPGIELPSKREIIDFFTNETTPEYWAQLRMTNPAEAESQLQQWQMAETGGQG